ncbi:MAG: NupC/NupG family nucleoside CNT transporter [Planctomycetaceae bacterium]|nr:NupC/NupG family nucleoside CNT transporter [Planctomycetaceae bacterium]
MYRLVSLLGIAVFLGLAWLMSSHKRRVNPRIVLGGLALQFGLAAFVLQTSVGAQVFDAVGAVFLALLECVNAGSEFVFGADYAEHFFAFKVLPTIVFFSAFMSIFYYYGVMQFIVGLFAKAMQKTLGTSGAETLSAAANVFVGQTEAPLVIRPYISSMTMSELNAVMLGGFATMAGGVLGGLVEMGKRVNGDTVEYMIRPQNLLAASVMAAPAALLVAKIMQPEVDSPKTLGNVKVDVEDSSTNVLEAIANGAIGGLQLALNVAAMLIVFLSLIAVVDLALGWIGAQAGYADADGAYQWSLGAALGRVFAPLAWLIGIEWQDCQAAGQLMGLKMATNEFVAYGQLVAWNDPDSSVQLAERSRVIMTYALCGFANFSSIGIQLGGIGGIAPERRGDLARLGLRAMVGGTLVAFINACVANIML